MRENFSADRLSLLDVPRLGLVLILAASCAHPAPPPPRPAASRAPSQVPTPEAASPSPAPPAEPAPAAAAKATDTGPMIRPCPKDSAAWREARRRIDDLDRRIGKLADAADPRPLGGDLAELLEQPCLSFAAEHPPSSGIEPGSAAALRAFWSDGGKDWIESALSLAPGGDVSLAPSMRAVLTRDAHPDHPLADLLCSSHDPDCAAATRGWALRAEAAFTDFAEIDPAADDAPSEKRCREQALAQPEAERYDSWRACVEALAPGHDVIPWPGVRAPKRGWLVVRGRRGHYHFCDEFRIYSLATGAAYVARSCSALMLQGNGGVNQARTNAARKPDTLRGTMSLDNLREAAWMMRLADHVQRNYRDGYHSYKLPDGIDPMRPENRGIAGFGFGSASFSSNQTTLAWAHIVGRRVVASGTLTWPSDYNRAARAHAVELLRIAEASFVAGCPRDRPPNLRRLAGAKPGVSRVDADPDELALLQGDLADRVTRLARRRCKPGR